jgi:flagellar motor switch protein FliM
MVNSPATSASERRERPRAPASGGVALGQAKLNPLGDLHTVQHLSARLARGLKPIFEPVLGADLRCWAEPLSVQRFADYRSERGEDLTAWLPLAIAGATGTGAAVLVMDARDVLQMLDRFFGGTGAAPAAMPQVLPPSAEALVARLGTSLQQPLARAWEPLAPLSFTAGRVESAPASLADGEAAMVVTRFGMAAGDAQPAFVDLLYPMAALKPYSATLAGKVVEKAEPAPAWRHQLTRAAMDVRLPVRSVLAEPVVPLSLLMNLKVGDVIPISFGPDVPVMVANARLGTGAVGTANGHAAVRLTRLHEGTDQ